MRYEWWYGINDGDYCFGPFPSGADMVRAALREQGDGAYIYVLKKEESAFAVFDHEEETE